MGNGKCKTGCIAPSVCSEFYCNAMHGGVQVPSATSPPSLTPVTPNPVPETPAERELNAEAQAFVRGARWMKALATPDDMTHSRIEREAEQQYRNSPNAPAAVRRAYAEEIVAGLQKRGFSPSDPSAFDDFASGKVEGYNEAIDEITDLLRASPAQPETKDE